MFWSIHRYDRSSDRCGKANAYNFDIISHDELTSLIRFSIQEDHFCIAVGHCWSRDFALPMGGPFSAQAANLHSIWRFHLHKQRFHVLGELSFTARGFPIWTNANGRAVSSTQFRDNILVAAVGSGASWAMADVCKLLADAWSPRVLCTCISDTNTECLHECIYMHWVLWSTGTLGHNLRMQLSSLGNSKMEISETDFFLYSDHPK